LNLAKQNAVLAGDAWFELKHSDALPVCKKHVEKFVRIFLTIYSSLEFRIYCALEIL